MSEWALISNNIIENVIVCEDGDTFATDYAASDDTDYGRAVDISTLAGPVAIGYVYKQGVGYVPPEQVTADPATIPPDGTTTSTVTYTDNRPDASGTVTFDVNGTTTDVDLTNGQASIDVTSTTAGDAVTVTCGGVGVTVGVSE